MTRLEELQQAHTELLQALDDAARLPIAELEAVVDADRALDFAMAEWAQRAYAAVSVASGGRANPPNDSAVKAAHEARAAALARLEGGTR